MLSCARKCQKDNQYWRNSGAKLRYWSRAAYIAALCVIAAPAKTDLLADWHEPYQVFLAAREAERVAKREVGVARERLRAAVAAAEADPPASPEYTALATDLAAAREDYDRRVEALLPLASRREILNQERSYLRGIYDRRLEARDVSSTAFHAIEERLRSVIDELRVVAAEMDAEEAALKAMQDDIEVLEQDARRLAPRRDQALDDAVLAAFTIMSNEWQEHQELATATMDRFFDYLKAAGRSRPAFLSKVEVRYGGDGRYTGELFRQDPEGSAVPANAPELGKRYVELQEARADLVRRIRQLEAAEATSLQLMEQLEPRLLEATRLIEEATDDYQTALWVEAGGAVGLDVGSIVLEVALAGPVWGLTSALITQLETKAVPRVNRLLLANGEEIAGAISTISGGTVSVYNKASVVALRENRIWRNGVLSVIQKEAREATRRQLIASGRYAAGSEALEAAIEREVIESTKQFNRLVGDIQFARQAEFVKPYLELKRWFLDRSEAKISDGFKIGVRKYIASASVEEFGLAAAEDKAMPGGQYVNLYADFGKRPEIWDVVAGDLMEVGVDRLFRGYSDFKAWRAASAAGEIAERRALSILRLSHVDVGTAIVATSKWILVDQARDWANDELRQFWKNYYIADAVHKVRLAASDTLIVVRDEIARLKLELSLLDVDIESYEWSPLKVTDATPSSGPKPKTVEIELTFSKPVQGPDRRRPLRARLGPWEVRFLLGGSDLVWNGQVTLPEDAEPGNYQLEVFGWDGFGTAIDGEPVSAGYWNPLRKEWQNIDEGPDQTHLIPLEWTEETNAPRMAGGPGGAYDDLTGNWRVEIQDEEYGRIYGEVALHAKDIRGSDYVYLAGAPAWLRMEDGTTHGIGHAVWEKNQLTAEISYHHVRWMTVEFAEDNLTGTGEVSLSGKRKGHATWTRIVPSGTASLFWKEHGAANYPYLHLPSNKIDNSRLKGAGYGAFVMRFEGDIRGDKLGSKAYLDIRFQDPLIDFLYVTGGPEAGAHAPLYINALLRSGVTEGRKTVYVNGVSFEFDLVFQR